MEPGALSAVLGKVRMQTHPNLLIGLEVSDDAAVYQMSPDLALIQTVDFFPPIVDDPYTFGAIAAANALSDVYAMGGQPIMAMVVAAFPRDLPEDTIAAILQGGIDKVEEAGAVVCGGHTVVDAEPKYGLCVTGTVHPQAITPKAAAQPGDVLLLTKPLGTGVITTACKRLEGEAAHLEVAVASMLQLNRAAAEAAQGLEVHSATDVTGFGLAGHAAEIARNSGVGMRIEATQLPLLPGAASYVEKGCMPGGLNTNREFLADIVQLEAHVDPHVAALIFDPQTSGGLLFALPPTAASQLQSRLAAAGHPCWPIGEVITGSTITLF